jgi:hypothetical protein
MRIALFVVGGLVALVAVIALIGWSLPVKHQVTREATFKVSAERLFTLIATPLEFPKWRTGVKSVEMLPTGGGLPKWTEISSDGAITFAVTESVPGVELTTVIADKSLPFGGSWTYVLAPAGPDSTTLRITEDGEVYNVIFRFLSRFVFGHATTIDRYLKDVRSKV